jgi:predicted flap endonuclease-1-like 5' DNA nuclease
MWEILQTLFCVFVSAAIGFAVGWVLATGKGKEALAEAARRAREGWEGRVRQLERDLGACRDQLVLRDQKVSVVEADYMSSASRLKLSEEARAKAEAKASRLAAVEEELATRKVELGKKDGALADLRKRLQEVEEELTGVRVRAGTMEEELAALRGGDERASLEARVKELARFEGLARENDEKVGQLIEQHQKALYGKDEEIKRLSARLREQDEPGAGAAEGRRPEREAARALAEKDAEVARLEARVKDLLAHETRMREIEARLARLQGNHARALAEKDEELARLRARLSEDEARDAQLRDAEARARRAEEQAAVAEDLRRALAEAQAAGAPGAEEPASAPGPEAAPATRRRARGRRQAGTTASEAAAGQSTDDLKAIRGVGVALEKLLHRLGVRTFLDVAGWTDEDVSRVDARLGRFRGRILRDGWREQARRLHAQKRGETP